MTFLVCMLVLDTRTGSKKLKAGKLSRHVRSVEWRCSFSLVGGGLFILSNSTSPPSY